MEYIFKHFDSNPLKFATFVYSGPLNSLAENPTASNRSKRMAQPTFRVFSFRVAKEFCLEQERVNKDYTASLLIETT